MTKMEKFARPVDMIIYRDGSVAFSSNGGEHFIYLYPDIVKQVERELRKAVSF